MDDETSKPSGHRIGQDLSDLSIDELEERIVELKAEIGRLSEAIASKRASADLAATFFSPRD